MSSSFLHQTALNIKLSRQLSICFFVYQWVSLQETLLASSVKSFGTNAYLACLACISLFLSFSPFSSPSWSDLFLLFLPKSSSYWDLSFHIQRLLGNWDKHDVANRMSNFFALSLICPIFAFHLYCSIVLSLIAFAFNLLPCVCDW